MILELELPALQARDLQLVEYGFRGQGRNLLVEPPVLRPHGLQLFTDRIVHSVSKLPQSGIQVIAEVPR